MSKRYRPSLRACGRGKPRPYNDLRAVALR